MTVTHGMDAGEVDRLGQVLVRSAGRLSGIVGEVDRLVQVAWSGDDGADFLSMWPTHKSRLLSAAEGLQGLGQSALNNVAEQLRTSAASGAGASPGGFDVCRLPAGHLNGGEHPTSFSFADYISRIESVAGENAFELLQVSTDPPRYIVLLPGIEGFTQLDHDTVRDLRAAGPARVLLQDSYADRVIRELERAGVPPGSEVMLMGHSYGAITAMNLASDPQFNQPGNDSADGPYHVQVTHVMAAGAGLRDWVDRPPEGTDVMLSINRRDHVATAIQAGAPPRSIADLLDARSIVDELPGAARMLRESVEYVGFGAVAEGVHHVSDGRIIHEFTAANDASGHHYDNYRTGLNAAGSDVGSWTDDAARRYFSGNPRMVSTRIEVFDRPH